MNSEVRIRLRMRDEGNDHLPEINGEVFLDAEVMRSPHARYVFLARVGEIANQMFDLYRKSHE